MILVRILSAQISFTSLIELWNEKSIKVILLDYDCQHVFPVFLDEHVRALSSY